MMKTSLALTVAWVVATGHGDPIEVADLDPRHILENFDSLPGGELDDQLADLGLGFENARVLANASFAVSAPNVIRRIATAIPTQVLFDPPVLQAGIQIDTDGFNLDRQPAARFYDADGALIDTVTFDQGPDFVGYEYAAGISRMELVNLSTGGASDGYDDLRFMPLPCSSADLAPDYGVLDLADIGAFTSGFLGMDTIADLNTDGIFDLADINLFVNAFIVGCP